MYKHESNEARVAAIVGQFTGENMMGNETFKSLEEKYLKLKRELMEFLKNA